MNWTKAMLDAVKGNERPHGLAKTCWVEGRWTIADLIEAAHKDGAKIELYGLVGEWAEWCDPHWELSTVYRVAPSWTPASERQWCMCTELKAVARDGWSTCSVCGGQDAYGTNPKRPQDKRKVLKPPEPRYEVERCEVVSPQSPDFSGLYYCRHGSGAFALSGAVNDPDFIAYEYGSGNSDQPRKYAGPQGVATRPVAVLFRRELKS